MPRFSFKTTRILTGLTLLGFALGLGGCGSGSGSEGADIERKGQLVRIKDYHISLSVIEKACAPQTVIAWSEDYHGGTTSITCSPASK